MVDNSSDSNESDSDSTAINYVDRTETLELLCTESRRVTDHQISNLNDIDDKAVRTVRIIVIILGLLLAAGELEGSGLFMNTETGIGIALLLVSMTFGVLTYTASHPDFGPGSEYIDDVLNTTKTIQEERVELLKSYADWMEDNDKLLRENGLFLLISQILLISGVSFLVVGIGQAVINA